MLCPQVIHGTRSLEQERLIDLSPVTEMGRLVSPELRVRQGLG